MLFRSDDASSTAILASTVYRLALLAGVHTHLPQAEQSRKALFAPASSSSSPSSSSTSPSNASSSLSDAHPSSVAATSAAHNSTSTSTSSAASPSATAPSGPALVHFTSDMWLTPVVNPNQFGIEGTQSPEGQAFIVEMHAAWQIGRAHV